MDTATSLKQKYQPSEGGQKSKKKSRMAEELTQEELLVLGKEFSHLLQPLNDQLEGVIKAFPQYQNEEWYRELETCQQLIPLLSGQLRSWEDLSKCPKLAPFSRRGLPFTLPEAERPGSQYKFVEVKFMDLDGCLKNIFEQSKEPQHH